MIVQLATDVPPRLAEVERLDRLRVECVGDLADVQFGDLCSPADDGHHVWLDIAAARSAGATASGDAAYPGKFDGMIAYANSQGWVNDAGTHVRAHVEQTGVTS